MKKNMFLYIIAAGILFTAAGRSSAPEKVTVSGKVLLVGNMPFVEMVIQDSRDKAWFIEGDDRKRLDPWVEEEVTVQGFPHETDVQLADGSRTFKRYTLSQITIVEPHE
jgi:hypothetical protein